MKYHWWRATLFFRGADSQLIRDTAHDLGDLVARRVEQVSNVSTVALPSRQEASVLFRADGPESANIEHFVRSLAEKVEAQLVYRPEGPVTHV